MGLREKVALIFVVVIILQMFVQHEAKTLRKPLPHKRQTVSKNIRNGSIKTLKNKLNTCEKYIFPTSEYQSSNFYCNQECKTKTSQDQAIKDQIKTCKKISKSKQKNRSKCLQCNKVKNETIVGPTFPESYCLKKGYFPEMEFPIKVSETWEPRYWRMDCDGNQNTFTYPTCTAVPKKRNKIKDIISSVKRTPPQKNKKKVNLLDKENKVPNNFNIIQNSANDEFDLSVYERSAHTNQSQTGLSKQSDVAFINQTSSDRPSNEVDQVKTDTVNSNDPTRTTTTFISTTTTPTSLIDKTYSVECLNSNMNLSESSVVKCLFDGESSDSKEASLDNAEFIFIPNKKEEKRVVNVDNYPTTPAPFKTTTEEMEFNTEGPTE